MSNPANEDERVVTIETKRLVLTLPPAEAAPAVVAYFLENRAHHAPFDPPRAARFWTEDYWRRRLPEHRRELAKDQSLRFFLFRGEAVVGVANFTSFVRGPFQCCSLGYAIAKSHEGQGLTTEALRAAIPFVFEGMGFHRIQANHLPDNDRSARVLAKLGFVREGLAKNYLFLDGDWRDHVLNSLTNPDPQPPPSPA